MAEERKSAGHVALAALFIAFLKISLYGFGGGLWARRIAVEQHGWLSEDEFADIVSLCQFMPGPNVVGIAVCVGAKLRGLIGSIAAVCGFVLIPWAAGFSLGVPLPPTHASCCYSEHSWRCFRCRRRATHRNGDQNADAPAKPPAGVRCCRARRRRHRVHEAAASRRPFQPGAAQHCRRRNPKCGDV